MAFLLESILDTFRIEMCLFFIKKVSLNKCLAYAFILFIALSLAL